MENFYSFSTARISEIFQSVQGEGKYAGVRQVFVRFFDCNIRCSWCDTPGSLGGNGRSGRVMSLEEIFRQIGDLWPCCHSVSLTGGEPLLQADSLQGLLPLLKAAGMTAFLETNGILHEALNRVAGDVAIVSMDMKLPSSTDGQDFWQEHEAFLNIARRACRDVFIKAVITDRTVEEDIYRMADLVSRVDPGIMLFLQPNSYEMGHGVIRRCLEYQMVCLPRLPNTRVMPQMHKFLKIR